MREKKKKGGGADPFTILLRLLITTTVLLRLPLPWWASNALPAGGGSIGAILKTEKAKATQEN